VIVNSPNNPSGVIYPADLVAQIVELCEDKGLYLIMDDIYTRLAFSGRTVPNPYDHARDLSEGSRLVIVNGVSKVYAMTGFRLGWSVANPRLTDVMTKIQSHETSGPSSLSQAAAAAAINGAQSSVDELRTTLENNSGVMIEQLRSIDGIKVTPPDGTFYCFVDFRAFEKDSTKLCEFLLDKTRVVTVPGAEFGLDGYLRLSTCGAVKDIVEGVARIKWALDPNAPDEYDTGERKLVRDW
jgi:aspartate aminotransferase